eukprot:403367621
MVESSIKKLEDTDFLQDEEEKIEVSLNAVGRAPKLKIMKIKAKKAYTFQHIIKYVRDQLIKGGALQPKDSLFLYVNSQFAPPPGERLSDLYDCFNSNKMLIVNYALTEAWG